MRFFTSLILAAVMAFAALPAKAQSFDIETVITDQITAFQADDFARAFTHASPNIKRLFGDPTKFGRMVTGGYPMVHRPRDYEFKELDQFGNTFLQQVLIEDQSGKFYIARYAMIMTADGWKIDGVTIEESPLMGT